MSTTHRAQLALVVAALSLTLAGAAHASPSASLEQVRNGLATATSTPVPTWVSGNAGASNSHYLESHSIPYRAVMGDLPTDGTVIELIVGYNIKRSGSYAIDFITNHQRLLPHVSFGHNTAEVIDPLAGVTGVGATVSTAPIPLPSTNLTIDPDGSESEPAAAQPATSMSLLSATERAMTLYGGTLIDVTYVSEGAVDLATGSSETQVRVRFTATSPKAVLAWGGHIACRWDWGFNADGTPRSAGGISGSSYHMRLVNWNLGSLGNQDRSLSTDAVFPVPRCSLSNLGPFCAGSTNTHTAPSGMESYTWTLNNNTSGAEIVGSATGTSVVVRTATAGSYSLLLTTAASGFTKECQGTFTVLAAPTADAGLDQLLCASAPNVQLAGQATGGGTTAWSGGAGSFSPSAAALNAIYMPTAAEVTAGAVTLTLTSSTSGNTCAPAIDQVRISFQKTPTANAGADLAACATSPQVQLAGSVGGSASGGEWSGGGGTFSPSANALNATYVPTAAEIAAGTVTLTLTTMTAGGPCAQGSDQVTILIQPAATANAGADLTTCTSSPQAQLAGAVGGGASTGTWSGGAGSFSPNASALNAIYTPTAAEIAAGGVTLTLTTNDPTGPCGAVSDQVRIDISPAAVANAGIDMTLCANSAQAQLAGAVSAGATNGTWSGGAGSFNPDASALTAIYTPTAAEIAAGGVTLTLTTNDPAGPCGAVADQVRINFLPAAVANAGADQIVCGASPQVQLSGSVSGGAANGTWSGGGGSFSPNASALNAVYTPSAAEVAAGVVTLTLTTNDPAGACGAANDQMLITISPAATANAGVDQTLCTSNPQAQLAGVLGGGATSGTWSGGAGSFSPNASALNAIYTPTAGEQAAGGVTLTLTTNDPAGPCPAVTDQVRLNFLPAAVANAGLDQVVCATNPQVQLAGAVTGGATSGMWSGGAGSFNPNASVVNAVYTPSPAEIAAGTVTLTLTTNDPAGPCGVVNDQVRITIVPAAVVDAGLDVVACSNSAQVQLRGTVGGSATGGVWSGGAGTFSPSRTALGANYTPSPAEIAAGTVTLTLTTTPSAGTCPPASDQMTILIQPAATVNAGPDQMVCAVTATEFQLAGSFGGGATSATWSGGAGVFTPSASTPNATYTPTTGELAAGNLTLTLSTNDPAGPCPAVNDQVKLTFVRPRVTVADVVLCSGINSGRLCANASNGVAPYTYLWSNGVTTQCQTVADTGSYTVTITDALGCQATGSGAFRHRDCVGMIAHTNVTCQTFMDGTGEPLYGDVSWVVKNNIITSIAPGVFFYYTKITAPRADFTVQLQQTKDNESFPFCELQQAQISLYDQDCQNGDLGESSGDGQATVQVTGATPGQVFIISVKYSLKTLVGTYMDETMGCLYNFSTLIDGVVVDRDPEGLQIGVPKAQEEVTGSPDVGGEGTGDSGEQERQTNNEKPGAGGGPILAGPQDTTVVDRPRAGSDSRTVPDSLNTYSGTPAPTWDPQHLDRPSPNPFSAAMRMAYDVGASSQRVTIGVYDIAGRLVRTLEDGVLSAGRHDVHWDGRDTQGSRVRKGMYFVHVRIGSQARQVRVTLLQ